MTKRRSETGAALLSILLIVATLSVAAVIATEAIARQTELQKSNARLHGAIWASRSAQAAALSVAPELVAASRFPASDDAGARTQTAILPIEGGDVVLTLSELPPCLNLNALAHPDVTVSQSQLAALSLLFTERGVPQTDAQRLAAIAADWVDADQEKRPAGAEDETYIALAAPKRAANRPMLSSAELASLPGFSRALRTAIEPVICTLPVSDRSVINANALTLESAEALFAMSTGLMSRQEWARFIAARPDRGWSDTQEIANYFDSQTDLPMQALPMSFSIEGTYFSGQGTVRTDAGDWPFSFLLEVKAGTSARIVWQSFGNAP